MADPISLATLALGAINPIASLFGGGKGGGGGGGGAPVAQPNRQDQRTDVSVETIVQSAPISINIGGQGGFPVDGSLSSALNPWQAWDPGGEFPYGTLQGFGDPFVQNVGFVPPNGGIPPRFFDEGTFDNPLSTAQNSVARVIETIKANLLPIGLVVGGIVALKLVRR